MRSTSEACGCFPTGRHYPGIAHLMRTRAAGIAAEFEDSAAWADTPIVMIDTETTGREPGQDRIVELAIVTGQSGQVLTRQSWLINPQRPIPAEASAVHGIHDKDVKDKPTFAQLAPEILGQMKDAIPAAYNASFDRSFILAEVRRAARSDLPNVPAVRDGVVWLDPLIWARHIFANVRSRKLGDIAKLLNIDLEHAHRATDDAEAALNVMYKMAQDSRVPPAYGAFILEQQRIARAQEEARQMWRNR